MDYTDLADLLTRQAGVPAREADDIASAVIENRSVRKLPLVEDWQPSPVDSRPSENAGLPLRFVAVLLDAVLVLFPAALVVGLLSGGGYTETGNGYAKENEFGRGCRGLCSPRRSGMKARAS